MLLTYYESFIYQNGVKRDEVQYTEFNDKTFQHNICSQLQSEDWYYDAESWRPRDDKRSPSVSITTLLG